ncbi:phosphoribosyl transferase [Aspergillus terreus]|uniref:uracil phosphoribosyltransferase n=1 Tax=Aspergillus terreus TaxID=33178 RepID=A0A5M3Z4T3_ASPTE|nr:hypothetical protein ATETN484_0008051600 [Aspergillus terreus]GFF21344.1 phosphoribosyl transferase [Aspergillus terreus]
MTVSVPTNVRQLNDARITSLLDKLRDRTLKPFEVRSIVHDLATLICKHVKVTADGDETVAVIVVLRSGLAMFDGFMESVPETVSTAVYHMGIFRDQASLQPVEYYNKLPVKPSYIKQAYVLDPLIATGGTAGAVVSILKDWGVEKVTFLSMLSAPSGLSRAASVWLEGTEFVSTIPEVTIGQEH